MYFRLHPHCVLCWYSLSPLCYHLLDQSLLHPPCVFYTQCCTHLVCIYTLHMLHPPCVLYTQCCTHLVCIYTLHMLNPPCVLYTLHMLHPPCVPIVHSMLHQPFVLYTLCCTHLVYEFLNPGLEHVDHVKSDLHQLVAAHQGARAIPPARLQRAPSCLRRCTKIFNDQQLSLPTKYIHLYYLKKKKNVHQSSRVKPIPVSKANHS